MLSAIEQLMLRWEKASLAAPKITTSWAPAASAPSKPFMFGVSTEIRLPAGREMRAMTSAASAICGTHFGDTKDVASSWRTPAASRRSHRSTFTSVETGCFSFCRPSRGPTSVIRTDDGRFMCFVPSGWYGKQRRESGCGRPSAGQ